MENLTGFGGFLNQKMNVLHSIVVTVGGTR